MTEKGKDALMRFITTVVTAALTALGSVLGINLF